MSSIIKFTCIIICFIITFLYNKSISKSDLNLLRLGMFFTMMADLFLIILDYHTIGVALFCIVQIIYISRYDIDNFGFNIKLLSILLMSIVGIYSLSGDLGFNFDIVIPLSIFYSICIGISLYHSIKMRKYKDYPLLNKDLILWGMVLFVLCDINVALSYMGVMKGLTSNFIWLFYLPSQFLLSISGYQFKYQNP